MSALLIFHADWHLYDIRDALSGKSKMRGRIHHLWGAGNGTCHNGSSHSAGSVLLAVWVLNLFLEVKSLFYHCFETILARRQRTHTPLIPLRGNGEGGEGLACLFKWCSRRINLWQTVGFRKPEKKYLFKMAWHDLTLVVQVLKKTKRYLDTSRWRDSIKRSSVLTLSDMSKADLDVVCSDGCAWLSLWWWCLVLSPSLNLSFTIISNIDFKGRSSAWNTNAMSELHYTTLLYNLFQKKMFATLFFL